MKKTDAGTLKNKVLHERRRQLIRLHKRGGKPEQIGQVTELNETAVKKIMRLCETSGAAELKPGSRGDDARDKSTA